MGYFSSTILLFVTLIFRVDSQSQLVLQNLNKTFNCLDVFFASQADGAEVGLFPCTPAAPNQQWQQSNITVISISVQHSTKCLVPTPNNLGVTQQTCIERAANLTESQFWSISTEVINTTTYSILKNFKNLTCLSGNTDRSVKLTACATTDDMRWTIGRKFGFFINKLTGLCVDVNSASVADGALVDLFECVPLAQNLRFKFTSYEVSKLIAVHSSKCLTVSGGSTAVGMIIDQFTCQPQPALNQLWIEVPEGLTNHTNWYFRLKNIRSSKCLTPGEELTQEECGSGNWNQLFTRDGNVTAAQQFRVKPKHSSKCLVLAQFNSTDGVLFTQKTCGVLPGNDERWIYIPSTNISGYSQLQNMFANKCLTATTDRIIDQRPCTEAKNQLWSQTAWGGLQNNFNEGQCLDALGANQADGALLGTFPCTPTAANHIWIKD